MTTDITVKTGRPEFDTFYPRIKAFLEQDTLDMLIDGNRIRGYRSPDALSVWIRDYSDIFRGFKYFEQDVKSVVQHFADTQAVNGRIFDYVTTSPEKRPCERENWTKYVRIPVEADVEYRFIKAAYLAWQTTGDDAWLKQLLPNMESALNYVLTHPWRYEPELGLVKRPYTIDSWDFAYSGGTHDWLQFQIDENTYWGIMHGDNSGYYQSFRIMSSLYEYFGDQKKAGEWASRAEKILAALNETCWNGSFYTHFVKLTPVVIPGVNESLQLSFSNAMNINRGTTTHEMAVSILQEYQKRKERTGAFAEWFSIDPPFPGRIFGDEKLVPGAYVNGGILPLVGGELAKAAFDHGFEEYGVSILNRYFELISEKGETYLWYFPDGSASTVETSTSPDATPTDGWGSSAMLYGFIEGLAGVEDKHKLYQKVRLSPRWIAADVDSAEVDVSYGASGASIGYRYECKSDEIQLDIRSDESEIHCHVMLPANAAVNEVLCNGSTISHQVEMIESSRYVNCQMRVTGKSTLHIKF